MEISTLIAFLTNASLFASQLFISVMVKEMGGSNLAVGLTISAYFAAFFLSAYIFGRLADFFGYALFLRLGLLLSTILFALQILARDPFSLLLVRTGAGLSAGMFPAALTVYAFKDRGLIGKFKAYGALGWALGSMLAGLLVRNNYIFIFSSVLFAVAFLFSLRLKELPVIKKSSRDPFSWELLIRNRDVFLPYFLRSLSAQNLWVIFPLYLMHLGGTRFWVGVAYFINTFSQFVLMQYVERFPGLTMFRRGIFYTLVTFILYALLQNFWLVLPLQVLIAFSFSTFEVGANQELLTRNAEKAGVAGILTSLLNLAAVIGPLLSGIFFHFWGFSGVMFFSVAVSFAALLSARKVIK
ncbi:MAG: MFS transporter [Candidatus Margulisbacteria bacterium]|nr:MFS transporter [Candidatus Margulisiibacteriota bacterium]MBU1616249.1 MFS transporter [Candidatus Margulisiibacteriota bacterium]MBU1867423.1 MFS transporter [Candidatus Margulisiibacteriota bacterium]